MAAQVGHIVQKITEEIIRSGYEQYPPPKSYEIYMKWRDNCTKIIFRATDDEIRDLITKPEARYFIDDVVLSGTKTEAITVVGFFPTEEKMFESHKLL